MGYAEKLLDPKRTEAPATAAPTDYSEKLLRGPSQKLSAGSVMIQSNPDRAAGAGAALGAGFIDKPEVKAAYFAAKRFPDLPPQEALKRYGYGEDGKVYYQADDGNFYFEVPEEWSWSGAGKKILGGVGDAVASAPAAVTGILTAPMIAAGPAGAATSLGLTGAAGAAGEGVRQGIGNMIAGDPVSVSDMAKTGAIDAATQGLGGAWMKSAERYAAKDLSRINPQQVADLERKAAAQRIRLTPAEKTNLPSLRNQQRLLSGMDGSADTMEAFYKERSGDVNAATARFLQGMSPQDSIELAGQSGRKAAQDAIIALKRERAAVARPLYEETWARTQIGDPSQFPQVKDLLARVPANIINDARALAKIEGDAIGDPRQSFKGLHYIKVAIGDALKTGPQTGMVGMKKGALTKLEQEFVAEMDKLSARDISGAPLYRKAREVYAHMSPQVDEAGEGLTGVIAKLKDTNAKTAANRLLGPDAGPLAMSQAKKLIQKQDPEAWQALKRAYLEDMWQTSSKQFASSNPAAAGSKYAAAVRGDQRQWKILSEALEPAEKRALSDLLDVLEATGRGLRGNSETVEKGVTKRAMERESSGIMGVAAAVADAPGKVLQGELGQWLREVRLGNHAAKVADIITSPDGMKQLQQLKKLSPNDQRFRVGLAQLAGIGLTSSRRGDRPDEPMYPMPTQ
jgi:hypothetical protein